MLKIGWRCCCIATLIVTVLLIDLYEGEASHSRSDAGSKMTLQSQSQSNIVTDSVHFHRQEKLVCVSEILRNATGHDFRLSVYGGEFDTSQRTDVLSILSGNLWDWIERLSNRILHSPTTLPFIFSFCLIASSYLKSFDARAITACQTIWLAALRIPNYALQSFARLVLKIISIRTLSGRRMKNRVIGSRFRGQSIVLLAALSMFFAIQDLDVQNRINALISGRAVPHFIESFQREEMDRKNTRASCGGRTTQTFESGWSSWGEATPWENFQTYTLIETTQWLYLNVGAARMEAMQRGMLGILIVCTMFELLAFTGYRLSLAKMLLHGHGRPIYIIFLSSHAVIISWHWFVLHILDDLA